MDIIKSLETFGVKKTFVQDMYNCDICDITLGDITKALYHVYSSDHKNKLISAGYKTIKLMATPAVIVRNGQKYCFVCNARLTSESIKEHQRTPTHITHALIYKLLMTVKQHVAEAYDLRKEVSCYKCVRCNIYLSGVFEAFVHVAFENHSADKVEIACNKELLWNRISNIGGSFECNICNNFCGQTLAEVQYHLKSVAHTNECTAYLRSQNCTQIDGNNYNCSVCEETLGRLTALAHVAITSHSSRLEKHAEDIRSQAERQRAQRAREAMEKVQQQVRAYERARELAAERDRAAWIRQMELEHQFANMRVRETAATDKSNCCIL